MFFLLAIVLLVVLPGPWNAIGFAACLVVGVGEVAFWNRKVRGRPATTGAARLVGEQAEVVTPCRPAGQVRVGGEIWQARCEAGADIGQVVRVVGGSGLTLVVERAAETSV